MSAVKLSANVTSEYREHVQELAKVAGVSVSDLIRRSIAMYEDKMALNILDRRMEEVERGDVKMLSVEEMEAALK